ncbi:MAG TPA: hypothetical protein VLJ11_21435 [Bryobacteraceae bacterium]|nr:hypothetical protein [Bryobacteraceae bacterium]
MPFLHRQATSIENGQVRVTVLHEGGHVAEILHKETGVNPLWIPPWESIEPSAYDAAAHPEYGSSIESKLLAGIVGHNLCLDLFGPPSPQEAQAGIGVHGESSVVRYEVTGDERQISLSARLPLSALTVRRVVTLAEEGTTVHFSETVENLLSVDRAIAWTQHVTLGPPFLQGGSTRFWIPASRSRVYGPPGFGDSALVAGAEFNWPFAPLTTGGEADLRTFSSSPRSAGYTAHLMDPQRTDAYFAAYSPAGKILFGYRWKREDFPWLGMWEENRSRSAPPWNGETVACGMEFGVSPFPETRRQTVERGRLFGTPCYRWLAARERVTVEYSAFIHRIEEEDVKGAAMEHMPED